MALAATSSVPLALGICATSFQISARGNSDSSLGSSSLVFVYGTLKKGFGNEWLMQELVSQQHACFVSAATTKLEFPLVCGPFQVPFLLNFPCQGHRVRGEVYLVDQAGLRRLDELEGLGKGHYERRSILVEGLERSLAQSQAVNAEAYFAGSSYAMEMLGAPHLPSYSTVEAENYVPRRNRPPGITFLEHVQAWIAAKK
ncbi:putative gamma-glutamylcyclotransferase At3g02910 [Selaginella moellendorffii]|nr:putative gamma-glutamylcyclotransferase At3g02910 [Selaginella moellendorffii]|eukprot:XP_002974012.2 putative gamma-glutamylcyclotransferase At3g02910 [Selaginella moellendorffii]